MTINKLRLSPSEEANILLRELEDEITKRLKGTLEIWKEKEIPVGVSFNKPNYRMNIYIEEREYHISVQGRGTDILKYMDEMLKIITEEIKL